MNQFKKRWAILRRNLETGVIEGYLGKPYYQWSTDYLYFEDASCYDPLKKGIGNKLRYDIFWYKKAEFQEQGKLLHDYFTVRLNSKNCPIVTNKSIGENRDPYCKLLHFEVK